MVGAKTCSGCRRWHSTCRPTYVSENGVLVKSACERCIARGIKCFYGKVQPEPDIDDKPRTGKRIEEARRLYGGDAIRLSYEDHRRRIVSQQQNRPSGGHEFLASRQASLCQCRQQERLSQEVPSQQDTRPSSSENRLRRHHRQGALALDLIRSVLRGCRTGFFNDFYGDRAGKLAISSLVKTFDMNGLNLAGGKLDQFEELNIALLCAVGSATSLHSAVIGCDPRHLPDFPPEWYSDDLLRTPAVPAYQYIQLPEKLDLRSYGFARQQVQYHLWQFCYRTFERNGFLDENRKYQADELSLLSLFRGFCQDVLPYQENLVLRRLTLKQFRFLPIGQEGGWKSRGQQVHYFEGFLARESSYWVFKAELPLMSDEDILRFLDDPYIPPKIYLSFDRSTMPEIRDIGSHHQLVWGAYLSIERMTAIAGTGRCPTQFVYLFNCAQYFFSAHSMFNISYDDGERVLFRMYSILKDAQSWRSNTIRPTISNEGAVMTPYGAEDPLLTTLDTSSRALCFCTLFRLITEHTKKVPKGQTTKLHELYASCAGDVDLQIATLITSDEAVQKSKPFWWFRMKLQALGTLPGGLTYLGQYLWRGSTQQELHARARHVSRIHSWCRHLSFLGSIALWQLQDLERGMDPSTSFEEFPGNAQHTLEAKEANSPSLTQQNMSSTYPDNCSKPQLDSLAEPIPGLLDVIIKGALQEIGVD